MPQYSSDLHFDYPEHPRHWHHLSEKYAGVDCLLTAMDNGWQPDEMIFVEDYWHAGARQVSIYHVELRRDGEAMSMAVIGNPYMGRVLRFLPCQVRPAAEQNASVPHSRKNGTRQ
jgi:hypothetical protein